MASTDKTYLHFHNKTHNDTCKVNMELLQELSQTMKIKEEIKACHKTPIYVHPIRKVEHANPKKLNYTDILSYHGINSPHSPKLNTKEFNNSIKSQKGTRKSVIDKLEETYWSNWKPGKDNHRSPKKYAEYLNTETLIGKESTKEHAKSKISKVKEIQESFQNNSCNKSSFPKQNIKTKNMHSIEIQTDIPEKIDKNINIENELVNTISIPKIEEQDTKDPLGEIEANNQKTEIEEIEPNNKKTEIEEIDPKNQETEIVNEETTDPIKQSSEKISETNVVSIKHTDSLIIIKKRQSQCKVRIEQPKCLKLFKKIAQLRSNLKTNKSYIRGGSYPLKSCLTTGYVGKPGLFVNNTVSNKYRPKII